MPAAARDHVSTALPDPAAAAGEGGEAPALCHPATERRRQTNRWTATETEKAEAEAEAETETESSCNLTSNWSAFVVAMHERR